MENDVARKTKLIALLGKTPRDIYIYLGPSSLNSPQTHTICVFLLMLSPWSEQRDLAGSGSPMHTLLLSMRPSFHLLSSIAAHWPGPAS
uniref:Uncharacterized protein n=1 Tax=Arundo donax TaxID=35708 RepID=A0A0A9HKM7_ARUDO